MRINHILFFLGTIFLTACVGKPTPKDIIPRDKMVNLLTQVHLIDGSLISYTQSPDTLYKYGMAKYLRVFKAYGTDTTQFQKSVIYYTEQPEVFDKMYDDILKILNTKTDSLNKVRAAIYKRDSVKNVIAARRVRDSISKAQKKQLPIKKGDKNN